MDDGAGVAAEGVGGGVIGSRQLRYASTATVGRATSRHDEDSEIGMAYYTDLFSVETYRAFLSSDRSVSGFAESQHAMARKLKAGDKLLVYVTGLSRLGGRIGRSQGPV